LSVNILFFPNQPGPAGFPHQQFYREYHLAPRLLFPFYYPDQHFHGLTAQAGKFFSMTKLIEKAEPDSGKGKMQGRLAEFSVIGQLRSRKIHGVRVDVPVHLLREAGGDFL